ncbi:MAG: TRAP transporter large permease [Syntrophales bacterium]|jgi:tripartite ATP-independent transporter DctM subunit|nr:TRAP transporter large permease [Syntrophales bacterium]
MDYFPLILLGILLVVGMPVAFAMGVSGAIGIYMMGGMDTLMGILGTSPYRSAASFLLTTLPLFIFMAEVISATNITRDLFKAAYRWIGHLPGGLGIATVMASALLGAMSGSSTASAAAMSSIAIPEMVKFNYKKPFAAGVVAMGGTLAIMIPPSIPMIVYGITTETSIGKLLIAGVFPGLLTALSYSLGIVLWTRFDPGVAPSVSPFGWKERFSSLFGIWPVLVLVLLVIGGMYSGFVTATEAAAVGAFGAVVIGLVMRRLTWPSFSHAVKATLRSSTMIFTIIIGAMILGYYMTISMFTQDAIGYIKNLPVGPWGIMIIIVFVYLILGCFMDQIAILLLTLPLTFPLVTGLGFDPIWFGVIVIALAEIGLVTPPIGLNAYIVSSVSNVSLEDTFKGVGVMLLFEAVVLVILLAFPKISTWLPSLMN